MGFYTHVFRFSMLEELSYPSEVLASLIRRIIGLGFLLLFWFVISISNPDIFTFKQMLSYLLIAEAIKDLSFSRSSNFGRGIQKKIKDGSLSSYLIRPINPLKFLYVSYMGGTFSSIVYSVVSLSFGIYLYPPRSIQGIILFPISLILSALTSYSLNVYIGCLSFYVPEAKQVKNIMEHIKRLLSGAIIPLSYFPRKVKLFAELTPFPTMTFYPVTILQDGSFNYETLIKLLVGIFWSVTLLVLSYKFWKKSVKSYEGVGI